MAPKAIRNPGDKTEGVKAARVGRGKGELPGVNKRPTSIAAKPTGENMLSLGKDAKISDSTTTPPLEIKAKGKSQSTITTFLAGGAQDSRSANITLPSEINMLGKEPTLLSTSIKKVCTVNNDPLIKLRQGTESVSEIEDNHRETREKEFCPPAGNKQSQVQQFDQFEQLEHQGGEGAVKESDLSSGDHSFGGSDDSETSEAENKSSSNVPTVRQLRRHRKSLKIRPCSQECLENLTSTGGRILKLDYSGIGLADAPSITNQGSVNDNKETDTGLPTYNSSTMGAETGMLQSIYSSIKELQTETRIESRRARIATKRLQGTVRKVAKSCTEIETKLCSTKRG
ncbi:hypothetical protein NDU88_002480 [Pleurodeles waltl]|uniref:Uncharacterized protein n=1 Tax=Pleurodeles waltl TaxID=8319 RepID=A0AAV7VDX4_PLEWA|nr:hypothetical protein NDU88_002480 [Pleurodeles waltl]